MLFSWPGGSGKGRGEWGVGVSNREVGEQEAGVCLMFSCSVPRRPVALGYGVRDVQEGSAHQVVGFVREG